MDRAISEEPSLSHPATVELFTNLIEPLNDSFLPKDRKRYYRLFAEIVQEARKKETFSEIDQYLKRMGLFTRRDFLKRIITVSSKKPFFQRGLKGIKEVFFPSRVTLGADVAITSVLIQKAIRRFPRARMCILGSRKLHDIFGGNKRIEILPVDYPRRGNLKERLYSAIFAAKAIEERATPNKFILIDPSSRISQLGMLPLVSDDNRYFLFEGVAESKSDRRSLSAHASDWANEVFCSETESQANSPKTLPAVFPQKEDCKKVENFLKANSLLNSRTIALSFGTGGNPAKRIGGDFEKKMVYSLLQKGFDLILDSGGDPEERERIEGMIADAGEMAKGGVYWLDERLISAAMIIAKTNQPKLLIFSGRIGIFQAIIKNSCLYLGYDSLFQHIAAALGVPLVSIFCGYKTKLFPFRWHPSGKGLIRILKADKANDPEVIVYKVNNLISEILKKDENPLQEKRILI